MYIGSKSLGATSIEFQREKSLEHFIKGLKPTIKKIFSEEEPETLDNACQKARTRELYLISKKGKYEVRSVDLEKPLEAQDKGSTVHGENSDMKELLSSTRLVPENQQALISLQHPQTLNSKAESEGWCCLLELRQSSPFPELMYGNW